MNFRSVLKGLGWLGAALLVTWVFIDPPLKPEVLALKNRPQPFDNRPENGFFLLAGIGQEAPEQAGRAWVGALTEHFTAGRRAPWPAAPTSPLEIPDAARCDTIADNCFQHAPPVDSAAALQLAGQYQRLLQQPAYVEFVLPAPEFDAPLPNFATLSKAQTAFHAQLAQPVADPNTPPLAERLQQERAGLTRLLQGSRTLVGKSVAILLAKRHAFMVYDALRTERLPAGGPEAAALTQPFSLEDVSMQVPLETELQMQLVVLDHLFDDSIDPFANANIGAGSGMEAPSYPGYDLLPDWARKVYVRALIKRRSTLNQAYRNFQSGLEKARNPLAATLPPVTDTDWALNPVGRILAGVQPDYTVYPERALLLPRMQEALNTCRTSKTPSVPLDWLSAETEKKRFKARLIGDELRC